MSKKRNTEEVRLQFKPEDIRMLYVCESAPASGVFFYCGNSGFTRYTRRAFETGLNRSFASNESFLSFFKETGCWLDDISYVPVNKLSPTDRKTHLKKQTPAFAQRLNAANPTYLIVTLKSITSYVDSALEQVAVRPIVRYLPFPGNSHQTKYMNQLCEILKEANGNGVLSL
jgi:hypothetical protein